MSVKHRLAHTVHAISFTVLALSGLSLMFKGKNVFEVVFGGKKGAITVHKTVAWAYATTNAYLSIKVLPEIGIRGSLNLKAFYQKAFYWFVFLSLFIMVPTGILLTFRWIEKEIFLFTAAVHKTFAVILIFITLIHSLLRLNKPQILFTSLQEECRQCTEKPCIKTCPTNALTAREDGTVEFDDPKCTACNRCVEKCPRKIVFYGERGKPTFVKPV